MNFTPFSQGTIPASAMHQFTMAKFGQNITTANGQVLGVLSGGEGGIHYLRPVEGAAFGSSQSGGLSTQGQTLITLPITMPGAKPGDAQQIVQIQVVNPNAQQQVQQPKYQMTQMPIQHFQQGTTVLTVAYSPQDGSEGVQILGNQGLPEGMTVVAAIQPQDLHLLAANGTVNPGESHGDMKEHRTIKMEVNKDENEAVAGPWQSLTAVAPGSELADYLSRLPAQTLPMSLHHFLKFSAETIKRESQVESSPLSGADLEPTTTIELIEANDNAEGKPKKKKKYKKKPPKPRRPKPGQVHIATALDGTTLFCCPECHMAYPEKEALEQHLVGHKIERRFICDICGAGLKRKEHLERHKLGHNPERPFICSVCLKGFKRKEHLNLHFVIHSGEKSEICGECGKGFYRKDHLRKHARSHITRKIKEELNQQAQAAQQAAQQQQQQLQQQSTQQHNIPGLPANVTIQVPTSNRPVPILLNMAVPQHMSSDALSPESCLITSGGSSPVPSTVVLPSAAETGAMSLLPHH